MASPPSRARWRDTLYVIIHEADTPGGKAFDVVLIASIVLSVIIVGMESMAEIRHLYGAQLRMAEWGFTALFSVEYVLRLISARGARRYATSFFGIVDVLAILPTYLSLIFPGGQYLLAVRGVRVLRVFRVFKLANYLAEAGIIVDALRASRQKITVFLVAVLTIVLVVGSLMYVVEGETSGFDNIPRSMYWAIVTMTTVGYGDISPQTPAGQLLASVLMIMGYAIIAVPTGIVTVAIARTSAPVETQRSALVCEACLASGHELDARFCRRCGHQLSKPAAQGAAQK